MTEYNSQATIKNKRSAEAIKSELLRYNLGKMINEIQFEFDVQKLCETYKYEIKEDAPKYKDFINNYIETID